MILFLGILLLYISGGLGLAYYLTDNQNVPEEIRVNTNIDVLVVTAIFPVSAIIVLFNTVNIYNHFSKRKNKEKF